MGEEEYEGLKHTQEVLTQNGGFQGINRKVQLKPAALNDDQSAKEILVVVKWGGVLTQLGREQSERLGKSFRVDMFPKEKGGLLRLHATMRHDLKIYSSDEGRVQTTAAAFAKGLLDLEGQLTPILVTLVGKNETVTKMLDDSGKEEKLMKTMKKKLRTILNMDEVFTPEQIEELAAPTKAPALVEAMLAIGNPKQVLLFVMKHFMVGVSTASPPLAASCDECAGPFGQKVAR
eukprot:c20728_g1_i7.p1 GENE.c20728_g1_i7~~c20728_g1_i7.p1  ORF type:complete len:233 (+),score=62.42 c20728_g1_i7:287-985(+)